MAEKDETSSGLAFSIAETKEEEEAREEAYEELYEGGLESPEVPSAPTELFKVAQHPPNCPCELCKEKRVEAEKAKIKKKKRQFLIAFRRKRIASFYKNLKPNLIKAYDGFAVFVNHFMSLFTAISIAMFLAIAVVSLLNDRWIIALCCVPLALVAAWINERLTS